MDNGLAKAAADAILQLRNENTNLKKELEHIKNAQALAFKLFKEGIIPAEHIESTIEKFASESTEELEITKRAFELTKTAEFNLFSLSSEETYSNNTDAASIFIHRALLESDNY
jgi:hypothetical protein